MPETAYGNALEPMELHWNMVRLAQLGTCIEMVVVWLDWPVRLNV